MRSYHTAVAHLRRPRTRWSIVAVCGVLSIVLGWVGWTRLSPSIHRAIDGQSACAEGTLTVPMAVAPEIAVPVQQAADAWAGTHPAVDGHCLRADVRGIDDRAVFDGLTGTWNGAALGPRPAVWLPTSTLWANRLGARDAALLSGTGPSIGSSPVLLALPEAGGSALQSGDGFSWSQLPALTSSSGWSKYGHSSWGALRVAFPDLNTNPATAMAVQSALAGNGPVTASMLTEQSVRDSVLQLAGSQTSGAPDSTASALTRLGQITDVAAAHFQAVPVSEVDLYRRNLGLDGAAAPPHPLIGVSAGGPNAAADFPVVTLGGGPADGAYQEAGRRFGDFLRSPGPRHALALAGLREPGETAHPSPSPGIGWNAVTDHSAPADANATRQLAAAWTDATANGEMVTALVDVSHSMATDGGEGTSRLDWVKNALTGQIDRSVAESLGLWEFSGSLDGGATYQQLAQTLPARSQPTVLRTAIAGMRPTGADENSTGVLAAYQYAMAHYRQGKPNEVVLVTDGSSNGGDSLSALKTQLASLRNSQKPLPLNVIALGPGADHNALTDLAAATGGHVSVARDGQSIDPALGQVLADAADAH